MKQEKADKKTDRRTRYTRNAIKDSLLLLLEKKSFEKITVTEICALAEINRGTFYLHYRDTDDVLTDMLTDALANTTGVLDHILCPQKDACTYPLCETVQNNVRYQPLFADEIASARIVEVLIATSKDGFVERLMAGSDLTAEQAEAVFCFQINGCLTINKMMLKNHYSDWRSIQNTIDRFIRGGLNELLQD